MGAAKAGRVRPWAVRGTPWTAAFVLGAALAAAVAWASGEESVDPLVPASRAAAAQLGKALKGELQAVMAEVGPMGAITVCRERAPLVAAEVSTATGALVSRTSSRLRNPGNAPTAAQLAGLADMERRASAGADVAGLEYTSRLPKPDGEGFLYMKAIPANAVCLVCHGETIGPEIEAVIARHYPGDQARGYRLGEMRGAFVVEWPAAEP